MKKIVDEVFGELIVKENWQKIYSITLFGEELDIVLSVSNVTTDNQIKPVQRNSYLFFEEHKSILVKGIEECLLKYYNENIEWISERIDDAQLKDKIVSILDVNQLGELFSLSEIVFPYTWEHDQIIFGLVFDVPWYEENNLVVKFADGRIQTGTEHIIL